MPVGGLRLWLCALLACAPAFAQQPDNSGTLDLFIFNQEDEGGGAALVNDQFFYFGGRAAAKIKIGNVLTIRPVVGVSQIEPGPRQDIPASVSNRDLAIEIATTTKASATNITTAATFDVKPPDSDWTLSPGYFFSYQPTYVSRGLDFGVSAELFGGNVMPFFNYGVRWDALTGGNVVVKGVFNYALASEINDNGVDKRLHTRLTQNFQFGFTQILSPQWKLNASLQYTRQDGFLSYPNGLVPIYDGDTPVRFAHERLPNFRNRFQLNVRVRYSPALEWSVGTDHYGYFDDWGIWNAAVEPSAEGPFVEDVAGWRVWYRFSYQDGTGYLRDQPQREHKFQTDDSDLGTFTTHGGGALFHFEVARWGRVSFVVRVSGYGLTRSDNIWGIGALIGTEVQW